MRAALSIPALLLAAAVGFGVAPSLAAAQSRADPEAATPGAAKPLVEARSHMIVAAHPAASAAGDEMLRAGGSAVDAAIAAQLVLNVVEPQSSGLGGGAFALHWAASEGALTAWDGRETAPLGARPDMFLTADGAPMAWRDASATGLSIGVPALPRLLEALHDEHGRLPWAQLFEPAIALAAEGFDVSPRLAASIERFGERLSAQPATAALFFDASGAPRAAGTRFVQPDLAATLRAIAEGGADAFYSGAIAEAIVEAVQAAPNGGTLNRGDLAAFAITQRDPLCMIYRDRHTVCGMGPPSSGATTVGQILGLLDHFGVPAMDPEDPRAWRLFAQASRLAYADRAAYLADPNAVSVPSFGLLDPIYLTLRAQLIDPSRVIVGPGPAGNPPWREGRLKRAPDHSAERPATTHLSVVDAEGNIVSLSSSIETAFGSARMAAGFLLNNQLTDFSFVPERDGAPVANAVAPGKRPRSSMAPTIVFLRDPEGDGVERPVLALGSPGGSRIIEYVASALIRSLDWELSPAEAAAGPHVSRRSGDVTFVESGPGGDIIADGLAAIGEPIERREFSSGLHIIAIESDGRLLGGADPRREGVAIGE